MRKNQFASDGVNNALKNHPCLLLAVIVFAVYSNVYRNTFLLDDFLLIVNNAFLKDWRYLPDIFMNLSHAGSGEAVGFYRPLYLLIYFFIYQVFSLSTIPFHILNVTLHAVNAGLVYRLGCRLGLKIQVAFTAAVLWAVHPLHTEAVTYMSDTAELLYSLFCLSGLLVLLPDFTRRGVCLAILLFCLALLCKETAVVFPALATASLFLVSKERLRPATYFKTWPLWLLAAFYMAAWLTYIHASGYSMRSPQYDPIGFQLYTDNPVNRVLTALATIPTYFSLIIWPSCLHMERTFPIVTIFWAWQVLAGLAAVVAVLLQIFWGRGVRGLALSWGLIWFAAAHSPSSGVVVPVDALVSEHWMYLPTVGIVLGMTETVAAWLSSLKDKKVKSVGVWPVIPAALVLALLSYVQNRAWNNPETFYNHIFSCGGTAPRDHSNLGIFYLGEGEFEKAIEQFRIVAADPGINTPATMTSLHFDLAAAYLQVRLDEHGLITVQGLRAALPSTPASRIEEGIEELKKSLETNPNSYWANTFLSEIYAYQEAGKP